ncbi:MAG: DUF4905 domain-containing protein [Chryseosolibacter sp.]
MAHTKESKFSYSCPGIIWNILADGNSPRLFLEVRDVDQKKVSFSALNLQNYEWLWKDVVLEERWWVSMTAIAGDKLLLTIYTDTNNPDKKSLLAYDVLKKEISWWYNGFSVSAANTLYVKGIDARFPAKEIILDLFTGTPVQNVDFHLEDSQNFPVIRPFQYEEGTAHFNTVRDFLVSRLGIGPVATIDYLEWGRLIMMSVFVKENDLANFLYGFNSSGALIFKETLGENLKGVGLDTFFIYSDHLIFVKNKKELVSCKIL